MGDIIDGEATEQIEERPAGAPEGAVAEEPNIEDIKALYEATGVKAPVPTGKPKGRPKATDVRAKDSKDKDSKDSSDGQPKDKNDKGEPKDAPIADENGDSGDKADPKGKKVGKDAATVPDESEETDAGVRKAEPKDEKDSKRGGEKDPERGTEDAGEEKDESGDSEKDDEKGKRPGKSNPEVEKRFQRLTEEKRERDELIQTLQKQLQEKNQAVEQSKIAQEDPEYTIDDFRKVRDRDGDIVDLDPERAELAWRRWKDGYDQRGAEREAKIAHEAAETERRSEMERQLMQKSSDAYDSLAALQDDYPELVSTSGKFDPDFAAQALPIIEESFEYLPGTEPGNAEKNLPVIIGMKLHPKKILDAMKSISEKKRNLPLNGVNDNVESRSNVAVPHSRSSDATVNAANDLYKELGIKKRI